MLVTIVGVTIIGKRSDNDCHWNVENNSIQLQFYKFMSRPCSKQLGKGLDVYGEIGNNLEVGAATAHE